MKIAALQVNPTVGHGREGWLRHEIGQAASADIIVLPELVTTGYPPRDLLLRADFIDQNLVIRDRLVEYTKHINGVLVFGFVDRITADGCKPLANAVCVAAAGQVIQVRHKTLLPTYDVFDERRYFEPGSFIRGNMTPFSCQGKKVGVLNCEEVWNSSEFWESHLYPNDPVQHMVQNGAEYLIVINASPYRLGVPGVRRAMMRHHCTRFRVGCTYVNQVGGNDEILFDGNSFALNERGELLRQAAPSPTPS
jgi:NAD+ synthase (glutamine-hydrolysing)